MNPKDHNERKLLIAAVDSTNVQSVEWDTKGRGGYATLVITLSPGLTTDAVSPTFSLEESDTSGSGFATVTANKTLALQAGGTTNSAMQIYEVDMRGRKRYLKLTVTPGNVATDDAVSIHATGRLSHLKVGPTNEADMVANTTDSVVVV
jgi:hypothetical protein